MKKKLVIVPIEDLDSRYSTQWRKWHTNIINNDFDPSKLIVVQPQVLTKEIQNGAFLDVCGTNFAKASQLMQLSRMIHEGRIDNDSVIFLHDAWFPGVEMLAYMRDGLGLNFQISGCFHAGTYDPTDFISKKGMGRWGRFLEESWLNIYDNVFVASEHHKNLIIENRFCNPLKIHNTGFPIFMPDLDKIPHKENIVVFPHRLTEDKQPHLFDELTRVLSPMHPDWKFIKTQEVKRTKQEYYQLLRQSKISVSFAKHENWGIGMQESIMLGSMPIVPDRLAYKEMYSDIFRYKDLSEAIYKVNEMIIACDIDDTAKWCDAFFTNRRAILDRGEKAIYKMMEVCDVK